MSSSGVRSGRKVEDLLDTGLSQLTRLIGGLDLHRGMSHRRTFWVIRFKSNR
jgi:hypothetical protein